MNKFIYIICFWILTSCGKSNSCGPVRKDEVCVNFVNKSDHDIKSIHLKLRGAVLDCGSLKKGERSFEGFAYRDDDFYHITVIFDNNDTLTGSTPLRAGWKITEIIRNENIEDFKL